MFKSAEGFTTAIAAALNPADLSVELSPSAISYLTSLGINGTNYTEVALTDGVSFEIIRIVNVVGITATIVRAQSGTTAAFFPAGTPMRFVWTANGIQEEAAAVGAAITITSNVPGAVTGGPAVFNIDVPVITAGPSLQVTGTYPNYTIDIDPLAKDEFESTGSGTVTVVKPSSDFTITDPTTEPFIALTSIFPTGSGGNTFGAGMGNTGVITGIRVSNTGRLMDVTSSALPDGVYNFATITVANGIISSVSTGLPPGSGTGTVTSISAGTGISVTGVPTVNPTIALSSTGVAAGTYEGLQINAQGQIVAVPAGFAPVSSIQTTTDGVTVASGGTGIRTVNIGTANESTQGLVKFADAAESVNFSIQNRVLSPARLKTAINSVGSLVEDIQSAGIITTPTLGHTVQSLVVSEADRVFITATVVFSDPTAGPDEYNQTFAIAIYVNGTSVQGLPAFKSGSKTITHVLTGFPGGVIAVNSTNPTGAQVVSGTLQVITAREIP